MNVFRAALTSDFWITGIAIARYIPRVFRVKQLMEIFFHGGEAARVSPACRECEAQLAASMGDHGS